MIDIFFKISILSYELGMIGIPIAHNLKVALGANGHFGPCGYRWQKVAQKPKSKRKEIEPRYYHHSIRLDELIILVYLNVKIG